MKRLTSQRISWGEAPWLGVLALVVLVASLPLVLPSFGVTVATEIFILAIFAMSLGLIIGYAGLVSLGHAAFFGAGAYTVALLGQYIFNTYLLIIAAVLIAGVLALLSGMLFFRSSGAYFLMLTLAFGQVLFAVAFQAEPITGGADGMSVSAVLNLGFGDITGGVSLYYLMGAVFLICYMLLRLFVASPAGKATKGVMENESRMRALGFNPRSYKLIVYTIAGMIAGLAGALYAYFNFYVTPELLGWLFSGQALIMVIVGGAGTLIGPALGAGFFVVLQNYLSSFTERWPLVMGLIFVAFVLVGRGGVIHLIILAWKSVVPARFRGASGQDSTSEAETTTEQEEVR